jgi:hypothetical protein
LSRSRTCCQRQGPKTTLSAVVENNGCGLQAWLAVRGTIAVPELFVSARGEPLTRSGFEYILRKHIRTASQHCNSLTTKRVSPHVLRHTCALTVLQATKDLRKVSLWLGHAHLQTTASGSFGKVGSPGISAASETALRALQGCRQADRLAKGTPFYAGQRDLKVNDRQTCRRHTLHNDTRRVTPYALQCIRCRICMMEAFPGVFRLPGLVLRRAR